MGKRWGGHLLGVALLAAAAAGPASAAVSAPHRPQLRKLGRGVANILTAPLEIIRTYTITNREEGFIAGHTVGLLIGVVRTGYRAAAGVYEVGTFYWSGRNNYAPIVKPEFVFAHGGWQEEEKD